MLPINTLRPAALCCIVALGVFLPFASQAGGRLSSDCRSISDDTLRLACYDGMYAQAVPQDDPYGSTPVVKGEARAGVKAKQSEPVASASSGSMIDDAWGFNPDSNEFLIGFYNPNYLLFARRSDSVNNRPFSPLFAAADLDPKSLEATEAAFQLSFKTRLWTTESRRLGLWFGYTQQSQWQVYNTAISSPFRDTNYMPEVFLSYQPNIPVAGFQWKLLNVGYNHQSNGRADPISRSWDRIFAEFGVERGNLALFLKTWYRIPESKEDDDNSDITDYYGHAQITAVQKWRDHRFSVMVRGNPRTGKGAVEAAWTTPPLLGPLRGYVKAFSGYGESMIDYNWNQNTIGAGVVLDGDMM